jgi:hypothetical protein
MSTQNIFIVQPNSSEDENALKAFVKALKMKFEIKEKSDADTKEEIIANIKEGFRDLKRYKKGKLKTTSAKDFLNEYP